ncbi:cobalt transporter [Marivirga tractuosa]|uniref:Cation diffusion facilitator family transporter n=1 Tax=Marivirga tractuosa (strain ATCC 23168 / DSM 4126 / NBRC 15989 / NCIMB 1408 / VKM B-1430 / H-43) TaxID=643867 RepID=E4TKV8_MARTH|nr:cation diffusion facilitator family transporter [Marivirga tractuosa]ADR22261.1 cation diffusion facilitator family transporter [Marivirga tractuosa DSM 4126]BDD13273.1 cobalt transporter [Marivirga tractuosa]
MKRESRLKWVILLNVIITASQIVGGIVGNSMALISDAMHNFSDVAALALSLVAIVLAKKEATYSKSFGYKRAEVLAAFVNSAVIIAVAIYIIIESIQRLQISQSLQINNDLVIWLAGIAIVANGLSVVFLAKDAKNSMNMKSAFLHLLSDTLFSVAVLGGGLAMKYYGVTWVDGVLSILIGVYLIATSWRLLWDSAKILMQFVPEGIDIPHLVMEVEQLKEVKNIHHIHIWQLDEYTIHLEAHVDLRKDLNVSETHEIQKRVEELLHTNFSIGHITLQFEHGLDENKKLIQ